MAARRRRRRRQTGAAWQPIGTGRALLSSRELTWVLAVLVTAAAAYYAAYFSPLFSLDNVQVKGAKALNAKDVAAYAKQAAGSRRLGMNTESLFAVDTGAVQRRIKQRFDDAADVKVTKQFPRDLVVTITERQQALLWQSGGKYYLVDRQGYAFSAAQPRNDLVSVVDSTGLPVEVGKQVVGRSFINTLEQIQQGLQGVGLKVVSFQIPETTFEIRAVTHQGWYALYDTTRKVDSQTEALKQALGTGKPAQYADLRVPGRVYLK